MDTREQLRKEFAAWLSNETWKWTTYGTLTFSRPMQKDALRFAKAWVRFIARTAKEVSGFCFQETHSDGQRLHVHCLLSVTPNLLGQPSNREMWSWWFQKFGRATVTDFLPKYGQSSVKLQENPGNHQKIVDDYIVPLASYLTKYMVKEAFSDTFDWDFYSFTEGFELTSDEHVRYADVSPTFLTSIGARHGIF